MSKSLNAGNDCTTAETRSKMSRLEFYTNYYWTTRRELAELRARPNIRAATYKRETEGLLGDLAHIALGTKNVALLRLVHATECEICGA
ncbi:hypothetical protein Msil_3111 [Methylocella silvestris BL2]|uniref:Uncharacterized protein n=1 Tax=Methylocella silvestris (strain DSM 15510 / CIP 108128 / LMG 27833 / NCIMB 13906 / BL2) TaxID=395965 RepID=B8EKZ2_METSB|nr:hypothetical protein Msil_3111 [Methylocella silvestris BL2]